MQTIFNIFIEYVTLLLLFYVLVFCLQGTCWKVKSSPLNHQGGPPDFILIHIFSFVYLSHLLEFKYCWYCWYSIEACSATQSCPALCDPTDCSLPGSSIRRIVPARILEWVTISSSRGFSPLRDTTHISCTAGRFFPLSYWGNPFSI